MRRRLVSVCLAAASAALVSLHPHAQSAPAERLGQVPGPLPIFQPDNWWNQDITAAPVDPRSAQFIAFIGNARRLHPDFGGYESPGSVNIYGFPYLTVAGDQPKRSVQFYYGDESDGVDHATGRSVPFYPIPDEAIAQPYWIEGGPAGNQNPGGDRHMLIVDRDNRVLYELFDLQWNGSQWTAGSGAAFDMKVTARRPDGWTSADAAGLAIFPGLVRYAMRSASPYARPTATCIPPRIAPAATRRRCRWARACGSKPARICRPTIRPCSGSSARCSATA